MQIKIETTQPRFESKFQTNSIGLNIYEKYLREFGFIKSFENRCIFSLYYDDDKYSCVADNLSGITPRCKYRLRWYSDIKNKNYGLRFEQKVKKSLMGIKNIINLDQFTNQINLDYSINNIRNLCNIKNYSLLPFGFFPQLICNYDRAYFEDKNGIRITIDKDIKFRKVNKNENLFFNDSLELSSNSIIVEIKFSSFQKTKALKFFRNIPSPSNRCSKYLLGQSKLKSFSYL